MDALAISYGTMHGASKGKDVKLRKEIAVAIRECLNHEGIFGALVSHGSSTVPEYIVNEINGLGGTLTGAIPDEDTAAITDCIERGVKEVVGTLIVQFGSYGKAPLVEQVSLEEMAERYKKMQI